MRKKIQSVEDLAHIVRTNRKALGMSQVDAAGASGLGPRFIGDLENAKPTCQIGKTLHLLKQLGIQLEADTGDDE